MVRRRRKYNNDLTSKEAFVCLCFLGFIFVVFYVSFVWKHCIWEWPPRIFDKSCYAEQKDSATQKTIENMPGKKTMKDISR